MLAFGLVGITGWGAFVFYATNQERLSSSVVRQILQNLRDSDIVRDSLGEAVRPEPAWYLNGDPWIEGAVSCIELNRSCFAILSIYLLQTNMLQGNVDISFRVKGSKGAGKLYFTSIRKEKGRPFTVCELSSHLNNLLLKEHMSVRYKIICDDGTTINLPVGLSKQ